MVKKKKPDGRGQKSGGRFDSSSRVKRRTREAYRDKKLQARAERKLTEQEQAVVEQLSPVAKERFFKLSYADQKRLLKKAERLTKEKAKKTKGKEAVLDKKRQKAASDKTEQKKASSGESGETPASPDEKKSVSPDKSSRQTEQAGWMSGGGHTARRSASTIRTMALVMDSMMSSSDYNSRDVQDRDFRSTMQTAETAGKGAARLRRIAFFRKKKQAEKAASGSARITQALRKTVSYIKKAIPAAAAKIASFPVLLAASSVVVVLGALVGCIAVLVGFMGAAGTETDTSSYQCQVSEATEECRELVEKYCEQYGIEDYVDLCLAVIEQESGGNGTDVMQTEQSYYNTNPPIDSKEESIDCGVHELADCLNAAECKSSSDISLISLALQGYNFGNGYINWAKTNYGGYTAENAVLFSQRMCASLGLSGYGDVDYVPHVLRYYVSNAETTVTDASAAELIKELKENNRVDYPKIWTVIEKGASLCGTVTYGMLDPPRQDDGRDSPTVLDCSSFVAWSFHKSGFTGIPYTSTTSTFISSTKFVTISADDLQPGDIGLKSETAPTGGANHVGIYCGKLKNGTKVWLHCTSSGSSLTGNSSGVMMSSYSNFTFFRRLKKWNK